MPARARKTSRAASIRATHSVPNVRPVRAIVFELLQPRLVLHHFVAVSLLFFEQTVMSAWCGDLRGKERNSVASVNSPLDDARLELELASCLCGLGHDAW